MEIALRKSGDMATKGATVGGRGVTLALSLSELGVILDGGKERAFCVALDSSLCSE